MKKTQQINTAKGIKYTICGEWFPDVCPLRDSNSTWVRGKEDPLATEMRLFSALIRWAFNRLLEGGTREELKKQGQVIFGVNSRYCDDAILKAQEIINSQQELLPIEIKETKTKLTRSQKKLHQAEKTLEQAVKTNDATRIAKAKLTVHGRKMRVKKLQDKLTQLQTHQEVGTIPKVVFGGRTLWQQVCKGKAGREEWRNARQNRLYARGDESKGGNPNLKITYHNGQFTLSATISHLSAQTGVDSLGRPIMTKAPHVEGKLWLPDKHRQKVWELLLSGAPYAVEITKDKSGRYHAHITFTIMQPKTITNPNRGYLGVDTNPDGVALASVSHTGQPEPWPLGFTVPYPKALHKFAGELQITIHPNGFLYIKTPELAYARGYRRTYIISVLAKAVVDIAKILSKPIAIEKLDFGKDRMDTNSKFNRMAANFPFEKITETVIRKAYQEGVGIKQVFPAHTSTIGYYKYMERYGITIHHAAAYTIARRAIGFKEKITKELKQKILALKAKLDQKANSLPGEGKGMTRKVKQLFKQVDEKILVYNGLTRFKQESFNSVWHDLKHLALSSR